MRFQRYPDGGARWTWFLWARHPRHSLTWTHSLALTRWRHRTGIVPQIIWDRIGAQRGYGIQWCGFVLEMKRQNEMPLPKSATV